MIFSTKTYRLTREKEHNNKSINVQTWEISQTELCITMNGCLYYRPLKSSSNIYWLASLHLTSSSLSWSKTRLVVLNIYLKAWAHTGFIPNSSQYSTTNAPKHYLCKLCVCSYFNETVLFQVFCITYQRKQFIQLKFQHLQHLSLYFPNTLSAGKVVFLSPIHNMESEINRWLSNIMHLLEKHIVRTNGRLNQTCMTQNDSFLVVSNQMSWEAILSQSL